MTKLPENMLKSIPTYQQKYLSSIELLLREISRAVILTPLDLTNQRDLESLDFVISNGLQYIVQYLMYLRLSKGVEVGSRIS